jgi:hypothetical protein
MDSSLIRGNSPCWRRHGRASGPLIRGKTNWTNHGGRDGGPVSTTIVQETSLGYFGKSPKLSPSTGEFGIDLASTPLWTLRRSSGNRFATGAQLARSLA